MKVVAVAGPTGAGKSALAVYLAQVFGGQVISCDSMQVYRGMDVGTGKVTEEEKKGILHRMIDVADPSKPFSLAEFLALAREEIEKTGKEDCLPVLCGGTGLYLDRLTDGTELSSAGQDPDARARLEKMDSEELYAELMRVDPESAEKTHPNNRKRVIRALEIYRGTGLTKSEWDRRSKPGKPPYEAFFLLLMPEDRQALYDAIDRRVEEMFERGLEQEARRVFASGASETAAQAIGYKEFLPYFAGEARLSDVKERVKQASRAYAKRQMTRFRGK